MHPERSVPPSATRSQEPIPPGYRAVDRDRLGEQGIVVLISAGTGKDNLGLLAGDGWSWDELTRWEPVQGEPGKGGTSWTTRWTDPAEAAEFADAYKRLIDAREGSPLAPVEGAPGRTVLRAGGRVVRVDLQGREVRIRVAPEALDAALEAPSKPKPEPKPARR
jgi:hypothetical protein